MVNKEAGNKKTVQGSWEWKLGMEAGNGSWEWKLGMDRWDKEVGNR
jgi:hypothetical protein